MAHFLKTTIEAFPSDGERFAALVRQLLRNSEAGDQVAVWLTVNQICSRLCFLVTDLLVDEPGWASDKRWLDHVARRTLAITNSNTVRVAGPITWGLLENTGGQQWAEPFEAILIFSPEITDLVGYTLRFGDRRQRAEELCSVSIDRLNDDIEAGRVDWAFTFRWPHDVDAIS